MRRLAKPANPWVVVFALSIGFFMIMLDTSIVYVAIPTMLRDLHASLNQVVWINSAYLLTFAVPLLLAGRLGDRFGRKPTFLAGMAIFTAASLLCGLAATPAMLIGTRALQGLGAATMAPQTMAFISSLFPPDKRGAPMGAWGGVGAVASATGPLVGGALVEKLGWQWIFIVNVPVGVIGIVLAALLLPNTQRRLDQHFDVLGAVLSGLGLLALVFGLQNGQQDHWGRAFGPVNIAEIISGGLLLMAAFLVWQRFNANEPLLPLRLLQQRNFAACCVGVASIAFALTGFYLPLTIYVQSVLGLSPLMAGLTTMPTALGAGLISPFAGRLSDRIGGKSVVMTGFLLFAVGIGAIAVLARTDTNPWTLRCAMLVCGLGAGCGFSPLVSIAIRSVPQQMMGAAAGVYNTARQVGSVIGSAAVGVLLQARLVASIHTAAIAKSSALPAAFRQRFIDAMAHDTNSAAAFGTAGTGASTRMGIPGSLAREVSGLATRVFQGGFTEAARVTLLLPIAVLAVGFFACCWLTPRTQPAMGPRAAPDATKGEVPAPALTDVEAGAL